MRINLVCRLIYLHPLVNAFIVGLASTLFTLVSLFILFKDISISQFSFVQKRIKSIF